MKKKELNFNYHKFGDICKKTQAELKKYLVNILKSSGYKNVIVEDGFIYAKGDVPVLLTAHLDTVHSVPVKDIKTTVSENGSIILSSPQGIGGDDRCGVYMILETIKKHKCSVLFCEDEEIGGIGSRKFIKTPYIEELKDLRFLIELDRANENDAVFYDCDNPDFTEFIIKTTGYKEAWGTFSDISYLAPECGVAAVNLSCGYYGAHTTSEFVIANEMMNTISVVDKLLQKESEQFEYIESTKYAYGGWGYYGGYYDSYYDDDDYYDEDNYVYPKRNNKKKSSVNTTDKITYLTVYYSDENGYIKEATSFGTNRYRAWFQFFIDNPKVCWEQIYDWEVLEETEAF